MRLCKEEIKVLKKENANLKEGEKQAKKSKTPNAQMASAEEGEDDEIFNFAAFANQSEMTVKDGKRGDEPEVELEIKKQKIPSQYHCYSTKDKRGAEKERAVESTAEQAQGARAWVRGGDQ